VCNLPSDPGDTRGPGMGQGQYDLASVALKADVHAWEHDIGVYHGGPATSPTSSGRVNWWAWRHTRRHREGQQVVLYTEAGPRKGRREFLLHRVACDPAVTL
jgi:hypothetical protein